MRRIIPLLLLLLSVGVSAQTINTDRPDQTESSATVPAGRLQVETGLLYMTKETNGIDGRTYLLPTSLFRVGISNHFELRAVSQIESFQTVVDDSITNRSWGVSNFEVGFKVNFWSAKGKRPEVGFLSHLVVPTGSEAFNDGRAGVINKLAVTHELSEKHTLAYNIGWDYFGQGNGDLFYSLAWGIGLSDKVGLYVEPYGFYRNLETWVSNLDAGFTYLLQDNVQLDYSFGMGLDNTMNYQSIGISFIIPKS